MKIESGVPTVLTGPYSLNLNSDATETRSGRTIELDILKLYLFLIALGPEVDLGPENLLMIPQEASIVWKPHFLTIYLFLQQDYYI